MIDKSLIDATRASAIALTNAIDLHSHTAKDADDMAANVGDANALAWRMLYTAQMLLRVDSHRDHEVQSMIDNIIEISNDLDKHEDSVNRV